MEALSRGCHGAIFTDEVSGDGFDVSEEEYVFLRWLFRYSYSNGSQVG